MVAAARRLAGRWFKRLGPGTRLVAICLIAIFLAGLALIADGIMIKAENDLGGMRSGPTHAVPTRLADRAAGATIRTQ
jgi:hypothetical protein